MPARARDPVTQEQLDLWELEGMEDESVSFYRNLLPFVTGPDFAVKWRWNITVIVYVFIHSLPLLPHFMHHEDRVHVGLFQGSTWPAKRAMTAR